MSLNPKPYHCDNCHVIIQIYLVAGPPGVDQPSDMGEAKCPWCSSVLEEGEI